MMTHTDKHYDAEAVRAALSIPEYLAHVGEGALRTAPGGWRGPCPLCGGSDRATKFSVHRAGEVAKCHGCDWGGDVFSLIMEREGLSFPQAVRRAAELGDMEPDGIDPAPREGREARRNSQREGEQAGRREEEQQNRACWEGLAHRSGPGEAYLHGRGLAAVRHPDVVRFNEHHAVCVPLRSLDDGRVLNVAQRRITEGEPKVLLCRGPGVGCFGDVRHLAETSGPVVVTEGVMDYLTALVRAECRLPLGARDAGGIVRVVEALAPHLRDRGVVLVMHPDEAGRRGVGRAASRAKALGVPETKIQVLEPVTGDLNDAWEAQR
jgi:hypothetical protein